MDEILVSNAQYVTNDAGENVIVRCKIRGKTRDVPMSLKNTDYAEIMRQVEAGTLTIQEAD